MLRSDFDMEMLRLRGLKKHIDQDMLEAYWEALRHESAQDIHGCVTIILQTDRLFPKIPRFKKILLSLNERNNSANASVPKPQSFYCKICDISFRVTFGFNDNSTVPCEGNGISSCGRSWKVGELKERVLCTNERDRDPIQL